MVRQPDATMQATPQDHQLMSKHRVLSLKPQLRLEWQAQDGQNETKQPDHSASLGDSITSSTRIGYSVHTAIDPEEGAVDWALIGFPGRRDRAYELGISFGENALAVPDAVLQVEIA
jgi:hypothetical protein